MLQEGEGSFKKIGGGKKCIKYNVIVPRSANDITIYKVFFRGKNNGWKKHEMLISFK